MNNTKLKCQPFRALCTVIYTTFTFSGKKTPTYKQKDHMLESVKTIHDAEKAMLLSRY